VTPFTFTDFEREAAAIVDQARAKANALLQQALVEAENVRLRARAEGIAEGRALVEGRRGELVAAAERELVALSVRIAERIVKAEIALGRPVAEANLRKAIELAATKRNLVVRACSSEVERMRAQGVEAVADESVAPGGVIVETSEGRVDLEIRTQLDAIERGLLA